MCNIAAYAGERDAAPILIEMMKKEEGWGGGYYSGLATIHEGRIYYAKLTGDMDRLTALTNAASLPGKIGIIHSRSKSGGDDEWAHPFVASSPRDTRQLRLAYVANGSYGIFKTEEEAAARNALAGRLADAGYVMKSRCATQVGHYPTLPDGTSAHMSDVMCQLIQANIDRGDEPYAAMSRAFCEMPSEIVGLAISLDDPDAILWSRVNQPTMLGYAPHGVYLATTALAFPRDAESLTLLPALSGGRVTREGFSSFRYPDPPCTVAPITPRVWREAYTVLEHVLATAQKPVGIGTASAAIRPLFEAADCTPSTILAYNIYDSFDREGRLAVTKTRVPGMRPDLDAPHLAAKLK